MTGRSTTTFVHIRFLEPKNGSAAAPADVLFDSAGHAHHHSRKFGIVEHKKAHEDPETVPRLSVRAGETIVWIADTEFQVETIAPGNPFATLSLAVKSRRDESGLFRVIVAGPLKAWTDLALDESDKEKKRYKATFAVNGLRVDPDFDVGP